VKVRRRDWLAAVAMSAGIGLFLGLASPSGGRLHAPGASWWLAGLATLGIVLFALAVAFGRITARGVPVPPGSGARRCYRNLMGFRGRNDQGTQLAPR
jgi:hypothetical protein